jgi:hypothetical protein
MSFQVYVHHAASIVEVIYPPCPSREDVAAYVAQITRLLDERRCRFGCLVDQRALIVMPPDLVHTVATLNNYAELRGMVRSARIVSSAVACAQTQRMAREASLAVPAATFASRDDAIRWLLEGLASAPYGYRATPEDRRRPLPGSFR